MHKLRIAISSYLIPFFHSQIRRWVPPLFWIYFTILFGWLAAYLITSDNFGWLALANSLAVYLFLPLPFILLANLYLHRREIYFGVALGTLAFAGLWGGAFLPRQSLPATGADVLTVMTYNVLGSTVDPDPILEVIRRSGADLVAIQELNPLLAAALSDKLASLYPYQILNPIPGVTGSGVISKYPLVDSGLRLPRNWNGIPQVLSMDWTGEQIYIVNFHRWATGPAASNLIRENFRLRELQARALVDFADSVDAPVILAGDANTTQLNQAYKIITASYTDAWAQAGFGLGHTFPGSAVPGSSRPNLAGWSVPQWLVRIDYIFLSAHFQTISARLAPIDGLSDHRALIAEVDIRVTH